MNELLNFAANNQGLLEVVIAIGVALPVVGVIGMMINDLAQDYENEC